MDPEKSITQKGNKVSQKRGKKKQKGPVKNKLSGIFLMPKLVVLFLLQCLSIGQQQYLSQHQHTQSSKQGHCLTILHVPQAHPCHAHGLYLRPSPCPSTSGPLTLCTSPAYPLYLVAILPEPHYATALLLSPAVTGNQIGCWRSCTPNRPTLVPESTVCIRPSR